MVSPAPRWRRGVQPSAESSGEKQVVLTCPHCDEPLVPADLDDLPRVPLSRYQQKAKKLEFVVTHQTRDVAYSVPLDKRG